MKKLLFVLALLACSPAQAQWQTPNHSVPLGRGAGVTGFKSVGPCAATQTIMGQGAAADPICGQQIISVKSYGATGDGTTNDTAAMQAAITAGAGVATVYVPCGTYLISSTLTLPSSSTLTGAGNCAIIKESASMTANAPFGVLWPSNATRLLLSNSDFTSGNSNIIVSNIAFDLTLAAAGAANHAFMCYKCSQVDIDNILVTGDGIHANDGTAFVQSSKYIVRNSKVVNVSNACYDQWQGSTSFSIIDNICNTVTGTGGAGGVGIVATGAYTNATAATPVSVVSISGNKVFNTNQTAIWIQG